jgi:cytochrome P450
MHMCVKDCILPSGGPIDGQAPIIVRKGTEVNIVFRAMQRNPDLWGVVAAHFRPERWVASGSQSTWQYMPFSRGARACPAQQMAL